MSVPTAGAVPTSGAVPPTDSDLTQGRALGRPARLLFVHAHPDDESLWTGVAIAHHRARGDEVHVLTCTLGEEGEVIPPQLAHLAGAAGDPLGVHRRGELSNALAALGAHGHLLGYRDSGMAGSAASEHPRALVAAPLQQVAEAIGSVIAEVMPDVVVTYDPTGWYGHPDHIRTFDAVVAAVSSLASPPTLFSVVLPRSWALEDRLWVLEAAPVGGDWIVPDESAAYPSAVVPDAQVDVIIDDAGVAPAVRAALSAHATQVTLGPDGWYALSDRRVARLSGREAYREVALRAGPGMAAAPTTPAGFRAAMGRLPSGVDIVTTVLRGADHAMTVDTLTSVSLDPLMVLICVDTGSRFHHAVLESGVFAVSVLAAEQESASVWFATKGRALEGQLDQHPHTRGVHTASALLTGAAAHLECRVSARYPAGDHTIVVAHVVSAAVAGDDAPALVHYRGRYGSIR